MPRAGGMSLLVGSPRTNSKSAGKAGLAAWLLPLSLQCPLLVPGGKLVLVMRDLWLWTPCSLREDISNLYKVEPELLLCLLPQLQHGQDMDLRPLPWAKPKSVLFSLTQDLMGAKEEIPAIRMTSSWDEDRLEWWRADWWWEIQAEGHRYSPGGNICGERSGEIFKDISALELIRFLY